MKPPHYISEKKAASCSAKMGQHAERVRVGHLVPLRANLEEKQLPLNMKVSTSPPDRVLLELSDANGATASVGLDRREAFALMAAIAQGVNVLPADPAAPLRLQRPIFKSSNPSFQVGIADEGNVVLAIMPAPFPSLEFQFDAQALTKLIADLRKAANVPSQPTARAN
jgi:hypothetical protein